VYTCGDQRSVRKAPACAAAAGRNLSTVTIRVALAYRREAARARSPGFCRSITALIRPLRFPHSPIKTFRWPITVNMIVSRSHLRAVIRFLDHPVRLCTIVGEGPGPCRPGLPSPPVVVPRRGMPDAHHRRTHNWCRRDIAVNRIPGPPPWRGNEARRGERLYGHRASLQPCAGLRIRRLTGPMTARRRHRDVL
jgi:hypothetical protein